MIDIQEIHVRSSQQEKKAFVNAYVEIWNAPENLQYLSFTGIPFSQDMVTLWVGALQEPAEIRYRIAVSTERIVGISVLRQHVLSGFELFGLAIHPEFKRQGIGARLVTDCITCSQTYQSIDAVVFTDNRPMLILLLKHGFIPVDMKHELRYDGVKTMLLKYYKR